MVETLINARVAAPIATDSSRLRDTTRSHEVDTRAQAAPLKEVQAPQPLQASVLALPVLAPGVLLVAQQARDTEEPPQTEDENPSLTSGSSQQDNENRSNSADEANAFGETVQALAPDSGAEIIPLYGSGAFSALLGSGAQATTAQPRPVLAPEQASDQAAAYAQANQAYVSAGAADGRTFGAAVFESVTLSANQSPVNLVV